MSFKKRYSFHSFSYINHQDVCVCALSHSVVSDSLWSHGLYPARLLYPWDFPGRNTGLGCHFLLQRRFLTQGSNLDLLHLLLWQAGFYYCAASEAPLLNSSGGSWNHSLRLVDVPPAASSFTLTPLTRGGRVLIRSHLLEIQESQVCICLDGEWGVRPGVRHSGAPILPSDEEMRKAMTGCLGGVQNPMPMASHFTPYFCDHTVQFSHSVVSHSLQPHGLQHARPLCPSSTPGAYSNSCLLSRWCHPFISSSVTPFSSRLRSFPASGSFQMGQLFTSGGQSIGVSASASVLQMNIQDWFPLGWTGLISLQSKGLSVGVDLQHHSSKASILQCLSFFIVQLSHPYMITQAFD